MPMEHEPQPEPPSPPPLDDDTVRRLAAYFDANAQHMLSSLDPSRYGPLMVGLSDALFAVQANLTAALALREAYDVDVDYYG